MPIAETIVGHGIFWNDLKWNGLLLLLYILVFCVSQPSQIKIKPPWLTN